MREKAFVCTGIFLILAVLLGSWACFRVEALAYGPAEPNAAGEPALPNFIYNPDCIAASPNLGEKHFSSGLAAPEDASGAVEASALVLRGRVQEVYYTFSGGQAWTQANVLVQDCYKGTLEAGTLVPVYFQGGYASAEDFGALYGKDSGGGEGFYRVVTDGVPLPREGEDAVLLLNPASEKAGLPAGAYVLSCGRYSVLSEAGEGQVRSVSGSSYSYEQLRELVCQA